MTSEEVMELIKGDTPMATELYEELTREEVETLLVLHNCLDDMLEEIGGCFDITLSTMRILQNSMWKLRDTLKFRPQADDEGNRPAHWKPYVLKDDPRAWYYEEVNA
jgi:hypothetical protein